MWWYGARPIASLVGGTSLAVEVAVNGATEPALNSAISGLPDKETVLRQGVLGINRRNAKYILAFNARKNYPLVDDKLKTKGLATRFNVAVPALLGVVQIQRDVARLRDLLNGHDDFVLKPAHGSQGDGIIVIIGRSRTPGVYRVSDGSLIDLDAMRFHVSNILSGIHSLGGQPDSALIEQRVQFDPVFEAVAYAGVPDVRVIVFLGVPVMAMIRLPTRMSAGRANLHQGAVGAGIDMANGTTHHGVWRGRVVTEHPDTGASISGLSIPHWQPMLEIAARSFQMTELGYQGVDLVLDKHRGPMLLELNARPGLNIQIANNAGLERRLQRVRQAHESLLDIKQKVEFAMHEIGNVE